MLPNSKVAGGIVGQEGKELGWEYGGGSHGGDGVKLVSSKDTFLRAASEASRN